MQKLLVWLIISCNFFSSDHIALLKAFVAWKEAKRSGRERTFCWENFLSPMTLKMMDDMRNQFFDLLSDIGFVSKTTGVKVMCPLSFQTCH
jgi:ATP-dependent RNA helicase DHX36